MTFESDLLAHLLGDPAIAAAVADQAANENRIYPLERPQGQKNLRAIVYTVLAGTPAANLEEGDDEGAVGGLENVRTQLEIWASTHDAARALARLVHARMKTVSSDKSIRAVRISRQSDRDRDTREYREILDYSVWHSPQS